MHAVQNGIRSRVQKGRTLYYECHKIKESFPPFIHGEHFMRSITMIEKGLAEK
jgi:hypothetical protein